MVTVAGAIVGKVVGLLIAASTGEHDDPSSDMTSKDWAWGAFLKLVLPVICGVVGVLVSASTAHQLA